MKGGKAGRRMADEDAGKKLRNDMMKVERQEEIKSLLMRDKRVTVTSLCDMLEVSAVTVRADLADIEGAGFLRRVHGGAILNEDRRNQQVIDDIIAAINIPYDKEQEHIGTIAAGLIAEDEWIYIGSGTTCYYIAKSLLKRRSINIITNNIYVVNIMLANPYANTILCGGTLSNSYNCTFGTLFEKSIAGMRFSKAFFTVSGAGMEEGYSVASQIEVGVLNAVRKQTDELYLVIDSSKFGRNSFMHVGGTDLSSTIITDEDIPGDYCDYYESRGVRVIR
jgi:DeoR/GlpR family transcriptional regulator of sugar metabolism